MPVLFSFSFQTKYSLTKKNISLSSLSLSVFHHFLIYFLNENIFAAQQQQQQSFYLRLHFSILYMVSCLALLVTVIVIVFFFLCRCIDFTCAFFFVCLLLLLVFRLSRYFLNKTSSNSKQARQHYKRTQNILNLIPSKQIITT